MTNKPKHTPGPWKARKGAGWIVVREHAMKRREAALAVGMSPAATLVSDPTAPWFEEGESEANARLMAAAPELLEALKSAMNHIKMLEEGIEDLRQLGATAQFCGVSFSHAEAIAAIAKAEGDQP